jgi:hypothetical protein
MIRSGAFRGRAEKRSVPKKDEVGWDLRPLKPTGNR